MAGVDAILEDAAFWARQKHLYWRDYEIYKGKIAALGLTEKDYEAAVKKLAEVIEGSGVCEKKPGRKQSGSRSRRRG